jgi:predicted CXXCH cytochrome family protein
MTVAIRRAFPAAVLGLLAVLLLAASVGAQRRPAASDPLPVSVRLSPQPADAGYVGENGCANCHRAEVTQFHLTAHARLTGDRPDQKMDCETCHGPGRAHVEGEQAARGDDEASAAAARLIFGFDGTVQENTSRCLTCHVTSPAQQGFAHSGHAGVAVGCQTCHATHLVEAVRPSTAGTPPTPLAAVYAVPRQDANRRWLAESLLKESQPSLCYSCHASQRAQFAQPFHHRVPEGSMKCTDCHNVHDGGTRAALNAPGWETCTGCHVDKHGPFVFEHAAVRVEGCAVCHAPHGATSRFLLNRRESRFLCLQCHGDTHSEQIGVPHSRLGFQTRGDCTRCHVTIHGSNASEFFLQ